MWRLKLSALSQLRYSKYAKSQWIWANLNFNTYSENRYFDSYLKLLIDFCPKILIFIFFLYISDATKYHMII